MIKCYKFEIKCFIINIKKLFWLSINFNHVKLIVFEKANYKYSNYLLNTKFDILVYVFKNTKVVLESI